MGKILILKRLTMTSLTTNTRASAPLPALQEDPLSFIPENTIRIQKLFLPLIRQIEDLYRQLPWPKEIQRVCVVMEMADDGYGDVAACANVIKTVLKVAGYVIHIDWVVRSHNFDQLPNFLEEALDPYVTRLDRKGIGKLQPPTDLTLMGPCPCSLDNRLLGHILRKPLNGPLLKFIEADPNLFDLPDADPMDIKAFYDAILNDKGGTFLALGLAEGTGFFIDRERAEAPLSEKYYCHSYLNRVTNPELKKAILDAMSPESSFNFGYAKEEGSKIKYIKLVAMDEREKNPVILIPFLSENCISKLIPFLEKQGYGRLIFKNTDGGETSHNISDKGRQLTIITTKRMEAADVKWAQLAAERLLSTGDNSLIESLCARARLHVYETRFHKRALSKQLINLAGQFSPSLSQLLQLFEDLPTDSPWSDELLGKIKALLDDPKLTDGSLALSEAVVQGYSFETVLEAALKRTVWQHVLPKLAATEYTHVEEEFKTIMEHYRDNSTETLPPFSKDLLMSLGENLRQITSLPLDSEE